MLHGIGAHAAYFRFQLDELSSHYRVIAWNAPGYMLSDAFKADTVQASDYAQAVCDFANALGLDRFVLTGNSFGSAVAQAFAIDPRLQVQACAVPLAMDLPFASPQTVRVRCAQPAWQLYVRVTSPLPAVPTAQPMAQPVQKPTSRAVLVAAVPLQRGMPVGAHQVEVQQIDAQGLSPQTLEQVSEVLHAEMARDVRAGAPISRQDVRPRVLVKRGQMVLMSVGQSTGFQITARVQALQDGRYGEQIKLKNTESGRSLSGLVMGPNQVQGL